MVQSKHGTAQPGGLAYIDEPPRRTPVLRRADVLVAGGGLAGVAAATAAARLGAKTLLLERSHTLGGMATASPPGSFGLLIDWDGNKIVGGVVDEMIDRLERRGGIRREPWRLSPLMERQIGLEEFFSRHPRPAGMATRFDFELLKFVCDELVRESGAEILFDTLVVGALADESHSEVRPPRPHPGPTSASPEGTEFSLRGVIVEGKSGRYAIRADVTVDATGDGDVAVRAGASFDIGRDGDGLLQPVSIMFTLSDVSIQQAQAYEQENDDRGFAKAIANARRRWPDFPCDRFAAWRPMFGAGIAWFNATRVLQVDATRTEDLSRGLLEGRRQVEMILDFLRQEVPGFEQARVLAIGSQLGVRESRRIVGDYVLTEEDVLNGRRFPDVVVRRAAVLDVHNPAGQGFRPAQLGDSPFFEVPYRCLLTRSIDNLLVAGRCLSSTHAAHGATRSMVGCVASGQAAGTAAALACRAGTSPREVSVPILQSCLREQGLLRGPSD